MKKRMRRLVAMLLATAMVAQQGSTLGVLAVEIEPMSESFTEAMSIGQEPGTEAGEKIEETQVPETKAEETKAPEIQAPETKVEETKAPETKAEEAKTAENGAEETEPTTQKAQTQETAGETLTESEQTTETVTEQVTEAQSEPTTEAVAEEATEAASETVAEAETEKEAETEETVVLEASIMQEVFQKTVEDAAVPMVKYTVKLANKAEKTAAEGISLKVLLADELSYKKEDGETPELVSFETLGKAIEAAAFESELTEADKTAYANGGVVLWKDQTIAAGEEKTFVFCAEVTDGQTDVNALKNLWFVNGEAVAAEKIRWANTELLEVKEELPSEFVFENESMIVTATLSDPSILPEGAKFVVEDAKLSKKNKELIEAELGEDSTIFGYKVYDMHFVVDGKEIEPESGSVSVSVEYKEALILTPADESVSNKLVKSMTADGDCQVFHIKEEKSGKSAENVTDSVEATKAGKISSIEFTTDSFSLIALISSEDGELSVSTDTFDMYAPYTLESFLNGYNALVFGNATLDTHCLGAVLVKGDLMGGAPGFADGANLPPSVVKGKLLSSSLRYNSWDSGAATTQPLYLGNENTVYKIIPNPGQITYRVYNDENDVSYTYNNVPGMPGYYQDEEFFNFDTAYSVVTNAATSLINQATLNKEIVDSPDPPLGNEIGCEITAGTNVTLKISSTNKLNIKGEINEPTNTVINILDSEIVTLPKVLINGESPDTALSNLGINGDKQQGSALSIVWNIPNATKVILPSDHTEIGHIIAPKAKVTQDGSNYNGTIICAELDTKGEGHCWPYRGNGLTIPTEGDFRAIKTVDSGTPTAQFDFTMEEIQAPEGSEPFGDNGAGKVRIRKNNGQKVDFGSYSYKVEGTYYYIIKETVKQNDSQYIYDETEYLVKVVVTSTEVSGDKKYDKDVKYYQIVDASDSSAITETVNGKEYKVKLVDQASFDNKKATTGEIEVTKFVTLNGETTTDNTIFYVALFSDARGNARVSGTKVETIKSGEKVTFKELELGKTYYVFETDVTGKPVGEGFPYTVTYGSGSENSIALSTDAKKGTVTITNNKENGIVELKVKKNFTEGEKAIAFPEDGFKFELEAVNGAPMPTGSIAEKKTVTVKNVTAQSFGEIAYTENGIYTYKIREVIPEDAEFVDGKYIKNGITYDSTEYAVTVDVTSKTDGTGKIIVVTGDPAFTDNTVIFTNTYKETTSKEVKKEWSAPEWKLKDLPESVTVKLYQNGEQYGAAVTLTAAGNWKHKWENLPKYDATGKLYEYTVDEEDVEGFIKKVEGTTITNTFDNNTELEVEKVWVAPEWKLKDLPESVTVKLYQNGEQYGAAIKLTAEEGWKRKWENLPKYDATGKLYEYTVDEEDVEGFIKKVEGTTITNTFDNNTELEVEKVWVGDTEDTRPEFIEVQLSADGKAYGEKVELNKANAWSYTWTDLPKANADGKDIVYTVEEISKVPGYTTAYATDETTGKVTITNTITSVKVSKVDVTTGAELEGAHIQILDGEGNVVAEWDSTKEAHEVKGLKTGETYTLKETVAPDGYTLTAETTFTLNEDGTVDSGKTTTNTKDGVLLVEDSFNKISILKVDGSGEALKGAKLVIKDAEGAIVGEPWKSGSKAHDITGLAKGSYTLSEIEAPKGYQVSADVPFEITGKETAGQTIEVKMTDEKIPESATYSLTVTKNLRLDGITSDIGIRDAVFYVALFSDEAKTQRVSSVKQIVFKDQISSSVTFDNLSAGTYYVGETDENGTLLVSKMVNDRIIFYPEYTGEGKVLLEGDEKNAIADFTNVYVEFTDDLYLSGQITVTKKILINGEEGTSDATYYAGVFNSPDMSEPLEIVLLELGGGSSTSYTVTNLPIGDTIGSSMTYYVTETDENGVPLDPDEVTEFEVSVDKSEIILDANNSRQEVVITNSFTEEETETETETEVPKKEAPKTGDDTNFMRYLLLMALSAGVCAVAFEEKRRKARRVGK